MAFLKNAIATKFYIDKRVQRVITACANCVVPDDIKIAFYQVTQAIADQLEKEGGLSKEFFPICCLFLESDKAEISMEPNQLAICVKLVFYPVPVLSAYIGKNQLYTILAEELCHLIWDISDEVRINDKVEEVMRNLVPDITKAELGYIE